ncbi:hypothetical protein EL17_08345 [Anditalea andensis]|uniref:HTH tetR-type domain-containing protein n=2 Tax=Anditalea andensis TaxID=1048983 RepID=A0A074L108_9BACT|nr:hypothetical protein EL17_08345 [Anditalea andensis]
MTKEEILAKAELLIMQQNSYDLDLGVLARHCGIGKPKLYFLFKNKGNLLYSLMVYICEKEKNNINNKLANTTYQEKLNCFFEEYFHLLEKFPYKTIQNFLKQSWESKKEISVFNQWIEKTYHDLITEKHKASTLFSVEETLVLEKMLSVQMDYYYTNFWEISSTGKAKLWKRQIIRCFS